MPYTAIPRSAKGDRVVTPPLLHGRQQTGVVRKSQRGSLEIVRRRSAHLLHHVAQCVALLSLHDVEVDRVSDLHGFEQMLAEELIACGVPELGHRS